MPRVDNLSSIHCSQQLFPYSSCLSLVLSLTLLIIYTKVPLLWSSLPAVCSILFARHCFPFGRGSLGNDAVKQPLVSVERGCWETTVNDAAPAQIYFFFFLPDQVSWRLCLYWRGVATFQFQLWDFYFFSEGCHFFFSRLNLIIIHSPSPWVWWGFRDNFTPN